MNRFNKGRLSYLNISLFALILTVIIGVAGFMFIENYTLIEALYMTTLTMSTVGFEEVRQLSSEGMIFTSFLIIISFGLFAYFVSSSTKYVFDGEFRKYLKNKKMKRVLNNLKNHVVVCGFGRNGRQAVHELLLHDETVVVIDKYGDTFDDAAVARIVEKRRLFTITGDAVIEDVLIKSKVETAKALITTLPSDADNLFIVLTAREFNQGMSIISRASEDHSDLKLKRAGASSVIMPDKVGGVRMATLVSQPDIVEFLDSILITSKVEVSLVEIHCTEIAPEMLNKTLVELKIRLVSGANLIGIKHGNNEFEYNPSADFVLQKNDKIFALGTPEQIHNLRALLSGKLKPEECKT